MMLKLEIMGHILGVFGVGVLIVVTLLWLDLSSETREFFSGGHLGAQIAGGCIAVGLFLGVTLFVANIIKGKRKLWWLRLCGSFAILFGLGFLGQYI